VARVPDARSSAGLTPARALSGPLRSLRSGVEDEDLDRVVGVHRVVAEKRPHLATRDPLAQLDRLISLSTLPNVRFGVIASDTQYVVGPWHGFWLRDNERVLVETFSAELNLAQAPEIALYSKIFEQFAAIATYGRSAREIITRVADEIAPEAPPEGE
jgi:hypothetical protein